MTKKAAVKSVEQSVDMLGDLQHKISEAQLKFNESIADLVAAEKQLREELMELVTESLPLAKKELLTGEEADLLVETAAGIGLHGKLFKVPVVIRNVRVLDMEKVREEIGQKKFNKIATVTIKDLSNTVGKETVDEVTAGYKPSVSIKVIPNN